MAKSEIMIDTAEFLNMLENFRGHSIGYIRTVTRPLSIDKNGKKSGVNVKSRLDKTPFETMFGCTREDLVCHATYSIMIGYDYFTAVNNANEQDGLPPHVPGESWHEPYVVNGQNSTTFVQHPGTKVVYFKALKNRWKTGVAPTPENARRSTRGRYLYINRMTGKKIPNAHRIGEYLPEPDLSKRVLFRTLKLTSVKRLAFQGEVYVLA